MPPQINLNDLYSIQKKKSQNRTKCFDKILELCHNRIKMVASHTGQNTFFEIPGFMMGFPLYNLQEAIEYVINALRTNGFLVQILPEPHIGVLYISWDPEELRPPKPMKLIRPRADIAYQQRLLETSRSINQNMIMNNLTEEPSIANDPLLKSASQSQYQNTQKYIMPLPESITPQYNPLSSSEKTRPSKHEPLYLSTLRLF